MFDTITRLQELHKELKPRIIVRLKEFKENNTIEKVQKELFFCLLTPQCKARVCWSNVENLYSNRILLDGSVEDIAQNLSGIRFRNNKSRYIVEARKVFKDNKFFNLLFEEKDSLLLREYIVKNIKGIGYKEASHFLRNIGKGEELAILDRHILRGLNMVGTIKEIPKSLSYKKYISIENKFKKFAFKEVQIPVDHLDFVFWYFFNGEIFK
ncbi:N-glycosylase/DNA lyase [bacterium]|nr:N-glycosylase/DNA lyase [bacterium]